jgi:hypothetical protein
MLSQKDLPIHDAMLADGSIFFLTGIVRSGSTIKRLLNIGSAQAFRKYRQRMREIVKFVTDARQISA